MKFQPLLGVAPFVMIAVTTLHAAGPAGDAVAGRELMKRYADAIVGVEMVVTVKMKAGDREQPPREQRIEVNGTVISAGGLTVTSLASVDPQASFEAMRAMQGGGRGLELVSTDFKEVKLRLADGKEVPARFVLKDADLDLAFMAPETDEPGREYPHVTLAQTAEGAVLDRFFFVSRAAKTLQRVPIVRATDILGIVEKPRRLFLIADQALAVPVFDAAGGILGITLQHFANGRPSGIVVLPAADIAEMAKQAAAAQAAPLKAGG
jgi:hypothetical protein